MGGSCPGGCRFSQFLVVLVGRVHDLLLGQDSGDLVGPFPGGAQLEDPAYHRSGRLIRHDLFGILILLLVPVGWFGARTLSALRLHLLNGPHLFAGVLGVEFVGPVADGVEVVAALHQGIHAVVDRDEPDALLLFLPQELGRIGFIQMMGNRNIGRLIITL